MGYKPGIISQLGEILLQQGINIYSVITSQTHINLLVDRADSTKSLAAVSAPKGGVIEKVVLKSDTALIAVVGEGLIKQKGLAARVFSAVAARQVTVEMISAGASEVAYYFIISEENLPTAIGAIHEEFFGIDLKMMMA